MKAFIISLLLTLILTVSVIANAVYISTVTEQMKSLVDGIGQNLSDDKAFRELENTWARHKKFFSVSVGFEEIDHVTEYITRLGYDIESGSDIDVRRNCALLQNFFCDVTRHEKISLFNIF